MILEANEHRKFFQLLLYVALIVIYDFVIVNFNSEIYSLDFTSSFSKFYSVKREVLKGPDITCDM